MFFRIKDIIITLAKIQFNYETDPIKAKVFMGKSIFN
ncbi:Uncharacterised protein [Prevotella disiens]|uniref:Uncharacterized protein n=2 Tax=Prevotella disiens TaxID=28130 RepID=A0A379EF68_9BACT|nr:Uncharacterised protein [Prevotella disiens]